MPDIPGIKHLQRHQDQKDGTDGEELDGDPALAFGDVLPSDVFADQDDHPRDLFWKKNQGKGER
jgi:hypothetical protein